MSTPLDSAAFRKLVADMRLAQATYFRTRDTASLAYARDLERQVDEELRDDRRRKLFDKEGS
jgi:hypothetical protein